MSRITLIDRNDTTPARLQLLDRIHKAFGATPNMFRAVAHSPARRGSCSPRCARN